MPEIRMKQLWGLPNLSTSSHLQAFHVWYPFLRDSLCFIPIRGHRGTSQRYWVRIYVKNYIISTPQLSILGDLRCKSDKKFHTTTTDFNICDGVRNICPAVDNSNGHYEAVVLPENLTHFIGTV